jgi:2,4-dienoyl-CoA reductase-like NADH-dependent reductase (Old Yellow Enzyme family)
VEQFKNLFSPFSIRDVELRNRVLITGHMTSFPSDGMPSDARASYFAERAKGGVGLIVMAWCVVHKNGWVIRTAEAGFDDAIIPRYKTITDRGTSTVRRCSASWDIPDATG